jgi:hypothetical protein
MPRTSTVRARSCCLSLASIGQREGLTLTWNLGNKERANPRCCPPSAHLILPQPPQFSAAFSPTRRQTDCNPLAHRAVETRSACCPSIRNAIPEPAPPLSAAWPESSSPSCLDCPPAAPNATTRKPPIARVYRIIQQAEQKVFGRTNTFTVDTPYSGREPNAILPAEIIEDRTRTNRRVLDLEAALNLAVQQQPRIPDPEGAALPRRPQPHRRPRSSSHPSSSPTPRPRLRQPPTAPTSEPPRHPGRGRPTPRHRRAPRASPSPTTCIRYFTGWSPTVGNTSRDSAINVLSVNLSQPLLRGFGRNSPQVEALTQAERNVVYAVRSYTQYQRQFAVDIVNAYFGLLRPEGQRSATTTPTTSAAPTSPAYTEARAVDRATPPSSSTTPAPPNSTPATPTSPPSPPTSTAAAAFKLRLGLPQSGRVIHFDDADLYAPSSTAGLIPVDIDRESPPSASPSGSHIDILNAIDRFEDTKRKLRLAADATQTRTPPHRRRRPSSPTNPTTTPTSTSAPSATPPALALDLPVNRLRERNTYRAAHRLLRISRSAPSASTLDTFKDATSRTASATLEQRRLNLPQPPRPPRPRRPPVEMNAAACSFDRRPPPGPRPPRTPRTPLITSPRTASPTPSPPTSRPASATPPRSWAASWPPKSPPSGSKDPLAALAHTRTCAVPAPSRCRDDELIPPDQLPRAAAMNAPAHLLDRLPIPPSAGDPSSSASPPSSPWSSSPGSSDPRTSAGTTAYHEVRRGDFTVSIVEGGTLAAVSEVSIRNEVEGTARVIFIVPEGSYVKKSNLLVELDSAQAQDQVNQQHINVEKAQFALIQAQAQLDIQRTTTNSDIRAARLNRRLRRYSTSRNSSKASASSTSSRPATNSSPGRGLTSPSKPRHLRQHHQPRRPRLRNQTEPRTRPHFNLVNSRNSLIVASNQLWMLKEFDHENNSPRNSTSAVRRRRTGTRPRHRPKRTPHRPVRRRSASPSPTPSPSPRRNSTATARIVDATKIYAPQDGLVVYPVARKPLLPASPSSRKAPPSATARS